MDSPTSTCAREAADLRRLADRKVHAEHASRDKQVLQILLTITDSAKCSDDLVFACLTDWDDADQLRPLVSALRQSITRIGWMADVAAQRLGDPGALGSAEEWLLPPGAR